MDPHVFKTPKGRLIQWATMCEECGSVIGTGLHCSYECKWDGCWGERPMFEVKRKVSEWQKLRPVSPTRQALARARFTAYVENTFRREK